MKLSAENLSFGYGKRIIAQNINLSVAQGEVLCLLGANGAGKTTLFKTLLGLIKPHSGRITLDNAPLEQLSLHQRARKIAYVPQAHNALFPFDVLDVVIMGAAAQLSLTTKPSASEMQEALRLLERFNMAHLADKAYTEISGGERQIVLIARALMQKAQILVMDEPTASLDYGNQLRILQQIKELSKSGISVILSTHNPDHVFICADQVALLHQGALIASGTPQAVITPENLKKIYQIDVTIGQLHGSPYPLCAPVLPESDHQ
ncbi:iron complex transport system ATP-binding protein [Paenochrobactrum gallinarii]|uniref:Iron complex transport system ATP-binding protein n=1 Tax=Paenochrobactrum gallinarii TaxID=643673 RepID=A0A841LV91_9HYPH|nr:ABC transporter ATP-binding protein [Paenochrobactrum gallinarii]MBB6262073.1 iron complex transport system ATP-binding protein [Paenochrobactrum gallinarii]